MSLLRAAAGIGVLAGLAVSPLRAQGDLRNSLQNGLFHFGDCPQPLCLNSSLTSQHGTHFIGATVSGTASLLSFLGSAVAVGVSNLPISTASSGVTFSIVGGVPVPTSSSGGPIFGERVQTLGQGRFLIGTTVTGVQFTSVRGVPLDNVAFTFTHENVCRATGAPPPAGGACPPPFQIDSALGSPTFENDVIEVNTSIDLRLQVAALNMTYGLTNRIDVGVVVPFVRADLTGGSIARIVPFAQPTPHFFGTASNPVYSAGAAVSGSATGIGDVVGRLKVNLGAADHGLGILAEAHFPTGDEGNFLGSGEFALRALAIASTRMGNFSPHLNAGYLYRHGSAQTDAVLTTVGFDQLIAPWATLAVDAIGQWQATRGTLVLPGPVTYSQPYQRQVIPTNIPNRPDNILDGSLGFKFLTRAGITIVTNALLPLNTGGIRGNIVWTGGAEYNF
ncbi:MAG TPA: hypothetical protein VMG41_09055 [Gemmatimonadales bacterium]|nr:hypothetical protein [Gemmatimonadales bacterium]